MRIGLFLKYVQVIRKGSENREIPDLWGRVDRCAQCRDPVVHKICTRKLNGYLLIVKNIVREK